MAEARRHIALPPREPARAAPLPRPAPSRTAAPRPREHGPAPPVGSRAETSRFREQFGEGGYPPTDSHCSPWGLDRCLHPQGAPVCVSACARVPRLGGLQTTEVTCLPSLSPSLPVVTAQGPGPSPLARWGVLCVPAGPRLLPALRGQARASIIPSSLCPINYSRLFEGLESACRLPLIFSIPKMRLLPRPEVKRNVDVGALVLL